MIHSIEVVLLMVLAVVLSSYLVRVLPFSLPLPLVQIVLGTLIAMTPNRGVTLDPEVFFLLFLPPLLFLDGWRIPKEGLLHDKFVILELSLGLVIFTVIGAGFLIHWMIPTMPMSVAFALAAIVSPTDPVAVSSIAAGVPIPKRLMHILEGESLLNDASGLVCFRFAVAAAMTGSFSLTSAYTTFLWVALGGVMIGASVTWGVSLAQTWITRKFGEDSGAPILTSLLIPFGAYLLAEQLHASGILAAVAAGISMSYVELSGRATATTRVQRTEVWNTLQFALNGVMFVLLGEQLPGILRGAMAIVEKGGEHSPWWLAVYAIVINLGLAFLRLLWVWVSLRWSLYRASRRNEQMDKPGWRLIVATSLAGVRGAITLAGVLTLPLVLPNGNLFPARDLVIFLAAAVIMLSLLVASFGLPRLLHGLTLPKEPSVQLEEDLVRKEGTMAAIAAIEQAQHKLTLANSGDADIYVSSAMRVMAIYRYRLESGAPDQVAAGQLNKADRADNVLWLEGLKAERDAIFKLARKHRISDETSRRLVRQIDLFESRFR